MNKSGFFSYFFRKSPLFRVFCLISAAVILSLLILFISMRIRRTPSISEVTPPIGSPGDIVVITGKNFGETRDTSYVEFGGSRLTASSYISWTDREIKVIIPANVQNGLVIVGTRYRSKPAFFANETDIPVAVPANIQTSLPSITGINPADTLLPGQLLVISGSNFGNTRDSSKVYFSSNRDDSSSTGIGTSEQKNVQSDYIAANDADYDYEFWSDSEIRLHVPDGAATGTMYVQTAKGKSVQQKVTIVPKPGAKQYASRHTYLLQISADISDVSSDKSSTITLRIPRPRLTAAQPYADLSDCSPEPVIADYQNTIIHQLQTGRSMNGKKKYSQNFVISVYEIHTDIIPALVKDYSGINKMLYTAAIRADKCVPSADADIKQLAKAIVQKEQNPYLKAKLIYNYLIDNYTLLQTVRKGKVNVLDMIQSKKGDAYDFALLYTALLRASGIPALPDCGILVNRELKTRSHWWCEFYIPEFGWVPVDPALGAGLKYDSWTDIPDAKEYYFGNLDSQHIVFSRGWNEIKPNAPMNKLVQHPRSYALQSIWEESTKETNKYSSFWADPVILGVY